MSRPFRHIFPAACAVLSLGFSACVGTVYDRMYSNEKTHFKPIAEKKEASAADIMKSLDEKGPKPGAAADPAAGAPALAPAGDIPGLPPAPAGDAAGAANMAPPPVPPPAN